MTDCLAEPDIGASFALDANRLINWHICLADSKFLCPGGLECDELGSLVKKSGKDTFHG